MLCISCGVGTSTHAVRCHRQNVLPVDGSKGMHNGNATRIPSCAGLVFHRKTTYNCTFTRCGTVTNFFIATK